MIAIIDYGMGNIHSVQKALESMGAETLVTNQPKDISLSDKAVLPGVGAFGDAIAELEKMKLIPAITEYLQKNKPFLGICLGMHLLFEQSAESPGVKGLGILKGRVEKFSPKKELKIPQMGWNRLEIKQKDCPFFRGLDTAPFVYFCHSYYPMVEDKKIIAATTQYGIEFASIIWQDNLLACQFHPEKSQSVGLKIIENFVKL